MPRSQKIIAASKISASKKSKRRNIYNINSTEDPRTTPNIQTDKSLEAIGSLEENLWRRLSTYLEPKQINDIKRAYVFSSEQHKGQTRISGEPYIYHPLSAATILADMNMDSASISAAILHDIIEDTPINKDHIEKEFGYEVASLVDGVSKLENIDFSSRAEADADNLAKMLLAMVNDLRVILVKLADRLHNMRTLNVMSYDKKRRIARETLDIYVPIALRLGINEIRQELENLSFQSLFPIRYKVLKNAIKKRRRNRKELMAKTGATLLNCLQDSGIKIKVIGREKTVYSIYKKMRVKKLSFSEVFDVYGFRLIVNDIDACYRALGAVHNLYKPVPGKFKDYIAIPKANGYQSLHTVLFGLKGTPLELQIRTEDMDNIAATGVAAHWKYKTADNSPAHNHAREWLNNILEMQQSARNSFEFLENVKIDLFPDEVYVFTPAGDIMELPREATALDFAYAVHSDIGKNAIGVKIDKIHSPLSTALRNGQTVEVITSSVGKPSPAHLDFVVTAKARGSIKHYLKNLQDQQASDLGERLLDESLKRHSSSLKETSFEQVKPFLKSTKITCIEDLCKEVGLGNLMAPILAQRIVGAEQQSFKKPSTWPSWLLRRRRAKSLFIKGTEGMVVSFANCCHPIPGDPVVGVASAGHGLVVHRQACNNFSKLRKSPETTIDIEWADDINRDFSAKIRVITKSQRGSLAGIASTIANQGRNIAGVNIEENEGNYTSLTFLVDIPNRKALADVIKAIRTLSNIHKVVRAIG